MTRLLQVPMYAQTVTGAVQGSMLTHGASVMGQSRTHSRQLAGLFFSIVFFMLTNVKNMLTNVKNNNRSCKFQCKVGQYVGDLCTGFTETNTETCNDCLPCPYGHYHINHSGYLEGYRWVEEQQACNGTGILPSDGYTSCRRCDTCPNGKFANDVGNCTGNGIWKTSFKCQDCMPCESGPIPAMLLVFYDNN